MCNPTVLYAATTAVAVAGAAAQGVSAMSTAKTNAKIAGRNADAAEQTAAADEQMQRRQAAKVIGQSRVDYAVAGVARSGTTLDMLEQETTEAELDALKIRAGGGTEAANFKNQQRLSQKAGTAGAVQAGFSGVNGLLSGGSSWMEYQQNEKMLKSGAP